jgi:acetyl esterase/lipase
MKICSQVLSSLKTSSPTVSQPYLDNTGRGQDLAQQREAGEHAEDMTSEPEGVTYEEAYAVDGLWATPRSWDGHSAIMYLYGGGYVISSPHSRRKLAGHLANASGARALVPRYSIAPERHFPSAVADATADYRRLLKEGHRPERVIIAGDSSAGGLTVATMLKLREDGAPPTRGRCPHIPLGGPSLHWRDTRDECHGGPHGDQG